MMRGGGATARAPDSGGYATPGPDLGDGSLAARTAQLQSLVGDLAQQVHAASRSGGGRQRPAREEETVGHYAVVRGARTADHIL